jgi:4-amino-4-deoxy-L-arabinose transferase-like glycosyltransferase
MNQPEIAARRHAPIVALVLLTVLGGVLRILVLEMAYPVRPIGDERYYANVASNIADGEGHTIRSMKAFRPPGQPFVLSRVVRAETAGAPRDTNLKRYLYLQVFLGTLLVPLTALFAWWVFEPRTGLVAAFITAIYPSLVAFSHFLWSEILFSVLLMTALLCVVVAKRNRGWLPVLLAGSAFGAAALTREVAVPVAGIVALWWLLTAKPSRRRLVVARGALMIVIMMAVVTPWTIRNYRLFDRLVPVSTVGWFAIREGNTFSQEKWILPDLRLLQSFRREYFAIPDELERRDFARKEAIELIRKEQPWWLFKKMVRTTTILSSPDSYVFKKVSRGAYGEVSIGWFRLVLLLTVGAYLVVVAGAGIGVLGAEGNGRRLLPILVIAVVFGIHLLANSSTRFRVPWMPLLIVYSSFAMTRWRSILDDIPRSHLVLASVTLVGILGWSCALFFPDAIHLWQYATYVDPRRP